MAVVSRLEDEENYCTRAGQCASLRLWTMIDKAVSDIIDHVTPQDMVEWEMESVDNYVI